MNACECSRCKCEDHVICKCDNCECVKCDC